VRHNYQTKTRDSLALSRTSKSSDLVLSTDVDEAQHARMFLLTAVPVHCCPTNNICTTTFSPQRSSITTFPADSSLSLLSKSVISCTFQWTVALIRVRCGRGQLKCDGTRAETRFRLSAKRTSPFKSARGRQFRRLLAAEMCASVIVMLDTPCSEVV